MASIMDGERQFHIKTLPDDVGKYVILPGDPGRVPLIANYLENPVQISQNREYNLYNGFLKNQKITICSTGIGGPSAAIAVEELVKCGANTFIRIGTSGGIDLNVFGGDLIIPSAAVRGEGTSSEYLPNGYPAVADFTITSALVKSAEEFTNKTPGNNYHVGVVHSKDSFYGEVEPENSAVSDRVKFYWESYLKCGCLTSEMECAAIFSVGIVRKVRCGAILTALWNAERSKRGYPDFITNDSTKAIKCALRALEFIIEEDNTKTKEK